MEYDKECISAREELHMEKRNVLESVNCTFTHF